MRGKKKTKWRKLPLEEFTKEIPFESEKVPPDDVWQADLEREENNSIPSFNDTAETAQNYGEPYEYVDGFWYPPSCVVYNPGMYSNSMMPIDSCYFYYGMPQMPEYTPVSYQEYTSRLPKDTVYLLLPAQAEHSVPPVRRRRRYEGYADYAIIPEKPSFNKAEEKERNKRTGQHVNSTQSNNFRRMTTFSETNNFDYNSVPEQKQTSSKSSELKKYSIPSSNMSGGPSSVNKQLNKTEKSKKNLEVCGIHTKAPTDKNEPKTETENIGSSLLDVENNFDDSENKRKTFSNEVANISNASQCYDSSYNLTNASLTLESEKSDKKKSREQSYKADDINLSSKDISQHIASTQNTDEEINLKIKLTHLKEDDVSQQFAMDSELLSVPTEDIPETKSQSSLPDILSTLHKSAANETDLSSSRPDSADLYKGRKSLLSQTSYLPNLLSSEALHNEMEMELKQLNSLNSLQANQSIYKLAYDENLTDADSRSPSPIDPESQMPTSLTSNEIIIHEADSGSDAGSEDVELLPHRYESETFLNGNKHVYVNKLSLAVELLRTQESLPYDDEFKRVVGENNVSKSVPTKGKVNLGFLEDSCSPNRLSILNHFENNSTSTSQNDTQVDSHSQLKHSANSRNFSDIGLDNLDAELCEAAKEADAQSEIQDNTEEIRAGYRRFGIQARHYFAPRAALSLNPCFCCIIM